MGRSKNYTDEYKEMISDLYNSEMSVTEISSEYAIVKSTINGGIKNNKKIKVSDEEFMTMKEVAKIKDENEILKKLWHICKGKLEKIINIVDINKHIYSGEKLCKVLGVPRSTYYTKLNHTALNREIKNEN